MAGWQDLVSQQTASSKCLEVGRARSSALSWFAVTWRGQSAAGAGGEATRGRPAEVPAGAATSPTWGSAAGAQPTAAPSDVGAEADEYEQQHQQDSVKGGAEYEQKPGIYRGN